ncbi:MAG: hypothetical protein ACYC1D_02300 [Acidimicrobiales bacterium]
MTDLNRRQFLRNASVGAAAAGAVAVGGTGLFSALSGSAAPLAFSASPEAPAAEGSDIFAHVANAKTGEITIFVGTKAVHYRNRGLAQQLLRAAQ